MKNIVSLAIISLSIILATSVIAEVPKLISYSGKLTDRTGNIVADKTYDATFSLWDAPTGGSVAWTEVHDASQGTGMRTYGGGFNVWLGGIDPAGNPLPAFDQNYWLEVTVTINGIPENFGRQQLISVPYALQVADNSVTGSEIVDGSITGVDLAGDTITWAQILDGTIRSYELMDGAVTPAKAPWAPTINGGINNPKMLYGYAETNSNGDADVTFSYAFSTVPSVVATRAWVDDAPQFVNIRAATTTGFHANTFMWSGGFGMQKTGTIGFNWIAIGY